MNDGLTEPASIVVTFEDLPTIVGRSFLGPWFSVTPDRLAQFDRATYADENPYSYADGYDEALVEGYHLLSLLDHLINPLVRVDDPSAYPINYGLDRVRFISPIHAGERFRIRGSILDVTPRHGAFLVHGAATAEVENRERPGFVADFRALWNRVAPPG